MSQRKNYFIEKGMQSKFIVTLLLLIFLVSVITLCNVYVIYEYVQNNFQGGVSNEGFFSVAFRLLGYRLFLIGLVNIIIVAIIGVFYSHQFAGPSYKLEKSIRQIAQGDLSFKVTLRKSDSMHNIAESLNVMVENFSNSIRKAGELTNQIKEATGNLATDDDVLSKSFSTMKGIVGELEDLIAGFKLMPKDVSTGPRASADQEPESSKPAADAAAGQAPTAPPPSPPPAAGGPTA
ncbi:MAG: methyl-accepting chemotaxis protein [Candidatus Riflebacteria bacterium]|nr:methyl-accepting chemotaxis protein [Candidatus Riflebacteria bacterium]